MQGKTFAVKKGQKFGDLFSGRKDLAAVLEGKILHDLGDIAEHDMEVTPITSNSVEGLRILRHSAAHLLAQAITEMYPDAVPSSGPATEDGFYYDIDMKPPSEQEMIRIEEKMKEIALKSIPIQKETHSRNELESMFQHNRFKLEIIREGVENHSTVYRQGNYVDFCRGPHVPDTSYLRNIKLLSIASTNFKGDIKRERLVRIYGTAFPDPKSLKQYLAIREEAAKRDHRKIGAEMELYVFNSERAPGLPLYAPNGATIRNELISFMREQNNKDDWTEVSTPHLFRDGMWKQSGHYAKYKDDMFLFTLSDGDSYALKPMNCPGHITIFESQYHSYRDLPVRFSEFGTVYRYEKSGEVGGLTRPRVFTVDDGHIFLASSSIDSEIKKILATMEYTYKTILGDVQASYDLSLIDRNKPENYLMEYKCKKCGSLNDAKRATASGNMVCSNCGSTEMEPDFTLWDSASNQLRTALDENNIKYHEFEGEAAFYGPKIDVHVKDAIGRSWQLATIQIDFFMPSAFNLSFVNSEGKKETPVMIHRAVYGSIERFLVMALESYSGKLPLWLSPVQAHIITVSEKHTDYATELKNKLKKKGIRATLDVSAETVAKKIKLSLRYRPAYILVIGDNEVQEKKATVRDRTNRQKTFPENEVCEKLLKEINERSIEQTLCI